MKLKAFLIFFMLAAVAVTALIAASSMDADAARFGGGKSFGSKPSMSSPAPSMQQPGGFSGAGRQPMANPGAPAQRSGMFGGMGGILGGVLAGTLLGSLLSGGGFSGGGLMDLLLFGVILFLGFKLFAKFKANRRPAEEGPVQYQSQYRQEQQPSWQPGQQTWRQEQQPENTQKSGYNMDWDHLRGQENQQAYNNQGANTGDIPQGFDAEEFLRGAKMAYNRLQSSWDKRDMKDIAQFTSPTVLREIEAQFAADPNPSKTEVLFVNAQLMGVTEEMGQQTAKVYFDAMLRENPNQPTSNVREVWHFVRPVSGGSWKLDGIQQVN